ncbi:hypothetical protein G7054_g1632 [Neopestalotiopsis clavispora]|nr:hypothetical protein G7054_g1632 [Neopestalotiopsis clavispora]
MDSRQVAVWESNDDLVALIDGGFKFQFAKSVIDKQGNLTYNVVWRSSNMAPRMNISWKPVYGLNWTMDIPTKGLTVNVGGSWTACDKGQAYEITKYGTFAKSTDIKADFLKIAKNGYQTGIHIVVGVQNSDGGFDVIYADPLELGLNMDAWYQPVEQVQWWYETGLRTSTIITGAGTPKHGYDFTHSNPETGLFFVSTTYKYQLGTWVDSSRAPPNILSSGVLDRAAVSSSSRTMGGRGESFNEARSKVLEDKVASLEKLVSGLLHNMNLFASGGYYGTIDWQSGVDDAQKKVIAKAIANKLGKKYSFAETSEPYNIVKFYNNSPPTSDHVPLGVEGDWESVFADYSGQASPGGLSVMGASHLNAFKAPQGRPTSNGTHDAGKAEGRKVMEETLRRLDGFDTEL